MGSRTEGSRTGAARFRTPLRERALRALAASALVLGGACAGLLLMQHVPALREADRGAAGLAAAVGAVGSAAAAFALDARLRRRRRSDPTSRGLRGAVEPDESAPERLEAILAALPDLLFDLDSEGRIRYFCAPRPELLFRPAGELLGRTIEEVLPVGASRVIVAALEKAAAGGHHSGSVYTLDLPGGRRWFELSVSAKGAGSAQGFVLLARDVTERALDAEELRQESDLVTRLLDTSPAGIVKTDREGRITFANAQAEEVLGLVRGEEGGRRYDAPAWRATDFAGQALSPGALPFARVAASHEPVRSVQHAIEWPDGRRVLLSVNASPLFDPDGEFDGIVATVENISERKSAERARIESAERLRATFDEAAVGMAELAPDGLLLRVNARLAELLGWPAGRLVGRSLLEYLDSDRARYAALRGELLAGARRSFETDARFRRGDGAQVYVHSTESAVRDAEGLVLYSIAVVEDVTARRQAESEQRRLELALRHAASEWAQTFDSLQSAVLLVGADGRVIRLNRATWELAGRPLADCLGRPLGQLGAGAPWSTALPLPALALRDGVASAEAHEGANWWEVVATRVAEGGPVVLVVRDVSRVRTLERSVSQAEQMAALGAVTAGVAHEVRNPLFAISASMDALRVTLAEKKDVHRLLDVAAAEVRRLSELMEDLLEYGKPSALAARESELRSVLEAAAATRRARAESVRTRIVFGEDAPPLLVQLDAGRMRQVFENAIDNAIQHSPVGGEVRIELERVEEPEGHWARCRVLDDGQGIASYDLPHLFEPFFTRRRGGTGLGLSIAQKIVREHGGRISIGNRPVAGAELVVDLPLLSREGAGSEGSGG